MSIFAGLVGCNGSLSKAPPPPGSPFCLAGIALANAHPLAQPVLIVPSGSQTYAPASLAAQVGFPVGYLDVPPFANEETITASVSSGQPVTYPSPQPIGGQPQTEIGGYALTFTTSDGSSPLAFSSFPGATMCAVAAQQTKNDSLEWFDGATVIDVNTGPPAIIGVGDPFQIQFQPNGTSFGAATNHTYILELVQPTSNYTATASPSPAPSPTITPSSSPSPTPAPSPTPTATPTASPSPAQTPATGPLTVSSTAVTIQTSGGPNPATSMATVTVSETNYSGTFQVTNGCATGSQATVSPASGTGPSTVFTIQAGMNPNFGTPACTVSFKDASGATVSTAVTITP